MRYLLLIAIAFAVNAHADTAMTTDGLSCKTRTEVIEMIQLLASKDFDSVRSYLDRDRCRWMTPGEEVTLVGRRHGPVITYIRNGERRYAYYHYLEPVWPRT